MAVAEIAQQFPLIRGGGAFLLAIGVGIVTGAFGARVWHLVCLIAGPGLGIAAMAVGGATGMIFDGLGSPEALKTAPRLRCSGLWPATRTAPARPGLSRTAW